LLKTAISSGEEIINYYNLYIIIIINYL